METRLEDLQWSPLVPLGPYPFGESRRILARPRGPLQGRTSLLYSLGIDLGTTFTAAAIVAEGKAEIFHLGTRATSIPTIVHLSEGGELSVGEAAERRGQTDPARAAREFKRRFGDPVPLMLGGTPYSAESLAAVVMRAVADQVAERQGETASAICITHPASYGTYKLDLLQQSVRAAGLERVTFLAEPIAAAIYYASQQRIEPGAVVAVYDLGGGTFDAAVLRKTGDGFEQLGQAEGLERLGGIDFDQSVFAHVSASLGPQLEALAGDPSARSALLRLREDCRNAKESLSSDTVAAIPVILPNVNTEIRLTRAEFEAMIRPRISDTLKALDRARASTGLAYADIDRVLLVGGSSRIPLIGQLVSEATGRPVYVDSHPKHVIAMGGALFAAARDVAATAVSRGETASPTSELAVAAVSVAAAMPTIAAVPAPEPPKVPAANPELISAARRGPRFPRRALLMVAGALAAVLATGGAFAALSGGDSDTPAAPVATIASYTPTTVTPSTVATNAPAPTASAAETQPVVVPTATRTVPPNTPTPAPTATSQATAAPTATRTLAPNTARITAVTDVYGQYQVKFEVTGFTPSLTGQHLHFFFDTVPVSQAGVPGAGPWFVYGGASPFTGYSVSEKPAAAHQVCVLVAKADHSVIPNTGNCFQLP